MGNKIELGHEVQDLVTGFKGIATARVEYLNGGIQFCVQICVRPKVSKDEQRQDGEYIDEEQLKYIGKGVFVAPKPVGGDQPDCPISKND